MIPQIKTILYTTTLGSHTLPVFRYTVGLARQQGARIVLLYVVEPLSNSVRFLMESYLPTEKAAELHHETTQSILDKFHKRLEAFCEKELGATVEQSAVLSEIRVISGLPHEVILKEAERCNADLIVMGSHTGGSSLRDLLGSTTRRVTLMSKRPVLIIPVADSPGNEWPESLI